MTGHVAKNILALENRSVQTCRFCGLAGNCNISLSTNVSKNIILTLTVRIIINLA